MNNLFQITPNSNFQLLLSTYNYPKIDFGYPIRVTINYVLTQFAMYIQLCFKVIVFNSQEIFDFSKECCIANK